ncbi:MAG: hypothetical protein M0C28_20105 [Candidatus Moduliflexus flocculans]|nr:hypothetical protein [Candidatus Moduliflexus flocculans]
MLRTTLAALRPRPLVLVRAGRRFPPRRAQAARRLPRPGRPAGRRPRRLERRRDPRPGRPRRPLLPGRRDRPGPRPRGPRRSSPATRPEAGEALVLAAAYPAAEDVEKDLRPVRRATSSPASSSRIVPVPWKGSRPATGPPPRGRAASSSSCWRRRTGPAAKASSAGSWKKRSPPAADLPRPKFP